MKRKLRYGMIGGGIGSFIGPVHRMAINLENTVELAAGTFSSTPEKSQKSGAELFIDPERVYDNYKQMAEREANLPADKKIDFVVIVTPNCTHYEIAATFLKAGFHVVCDKPLTDNLEKARKLQAVVESTGKLFMVTHNYSGYPMVKQAKYMVENGDLGTITRLVLEYPQGWLTSFANDGGSQLSGWRMDPAIAGNSCAVGDIGIHVEHLGRYISGLSPTHVCADITPFIKTSPLENEANILLRFDNGAKGLLWTSQVAPGEENGINVRIYGTKQGLYWNQENPNYLEIRNPDGYTTRLARGNDILCEAAKNSTRLPFGHSEGFIGAFANLYKAFCRAVAADILGGDPGDMDFPTIKDGVHGVAFIDTVLKSAKSDQKWVPMV